MNEVWIVWSRRDEPYHGSVWKTEEEARSAAQAIKIFWEKFGPLDAKSILVEKYVKSK